MQGFDSFDEDDEGGDGFASFEEFGVREARKLRGYLEDLDHKVFDVEAVISQEPELEEKAKPRRYYSVGYDAHQELVTDKDLAEWQRAFPQLRVCGVQIPGPSAEAEAEAEADGGEDEFAEEYLGNQEVGVETAEDENREPDLTMAVRGSQVQFHWPTHLQEVTHFPHKRDFTEYGGSAVGTGVAVVEDEEPETILYMDGILEEVIAIDHSGDTKATGKAGGPSPPVSPTSARKYEMTSLLLDSVWPNVVEALRPLVRRVVRHQLEHGVPVAEELPVRRSEWSDIDEDEDQPAMKISAW